MKSRIALTVLLLTSTSAFAADLAPQPVEPVAPVYVPYVWTGFYAGGHIGVVGSDSKVDNLFFHTSNSYNDTAFIGGLHAGYNYEFEGGFVLGLEGDVDYTGLSKSRGGNILFADGSSASFSDKVESDWQGSIRARLGYAFDRFLPYVTGGVAFANNKYELSGVDSVIGAFGGSSRETRTGWTIGGGLEYALTDNWLLRAEVRYSDFGSNTFVFGGPLGINGKVRFHEVAGTVGVSYKFNSPWF
jgi:outer membrane immunogenic protein